jgi:hypothetical protein
VGCHKEELEKDDTISSPTKCAQCHPKEEEEPGG